MTLVSDIILDAYRESNLISINATPNDNENTEALRLLNRVIASVYGDDAGERLQPLVIGTNNISKPVGFPWYSQVPPGNDWYVPSNCRLVLNLTSAQTVYLDPNPMDGARFAFIDKSGNLDVYNLTINANGRTIDGSFIETSGTPDAANEYMYREDTGDWALISPLDLDDEMPFPIEYDDLFVIGLSRRLNPRNAVASDPQSDNRYSSVLRDFKAKYRQKLEVGSELALIRLTGTTRQRYMDNNDYAASAFQSGYPFPYRTI